MHANVGEFLSLCSNFLSKAEKERRIVANDLVFQSGTGLKNVSPLNLHFFIIRICFHINKESKVESDFKFVALYQIDLAVFT